MGLKASDRGGLERLCRYILRPPLAKACLSQNADGTVVVGLEKAWSDGTTSIELSPADPQRGEGGRKPPAARSRGWTVRLVEKPAALVPPPFVNTIVYRGVLAGHAAWRREVVPKPPEERSRAVVQGRAATKVVEGPVKATGPP